MASGKFQAVVSEEKNPRGIPKAPFIADVEEYVGGLDGDIEGPLKAFQDAMALIGRRRERARPRKATDLDDDLDDEADDASSKPIRTTFELNETLYAEAELAETDTVYLWLGANVMLSYKIPEAIALLKSKLEAAETSLQNTIEDLEFIREQLTIMEVNTARVYNWDVKRRRERREKEALEGSSGTIQGDSG
ncbi:Prefoldin subunit-domain-containing protein [Armillaria luteobubalina]|uniref:Prefoldin subunit 3 n=1 Tax=Armillaria luteobubalina TaxID=153913 RepID=A0AA39QHS3_9AGAR|nr:Prefoldin subunit-domain-containing protein [Armillaria luteobubalina]